MTAEELFSSSTTTNHHPIHDWHLMAPIPYYAREKFHDDAVSSEQVTKQEIMTTSVRRSRRRAAIVSAAVVALGLLSLAMVVGVFTAAVVSGGSVGCAGAMEAARKVGDTAKGFLSQSGNDLKKRNGVHARQTPPPAAAPGPPMVNLGYATYRGATIADGTINRWYGIRYAAPPTGNRRWRAPVDPLRETGIIEATQQPPICFGVNYYGSSPNMSEDCLFADVWAPANATANSRLPVWVFIQGGGFNANNNHDFDGETMVKRSNNNAIFVSFAHRVGMWGFLASPEVQKDGDLNVGILDQRQLLKWVQKHISRFGGDPRRVTLSGFSAGAASVMYQQIAYGGRNDNLFHAVLSESPYLPPQPHPADLKWQFDRVADAVGCNPHRPTSPPPAGAPTVKWSGPLYGDSGKPLSHHKRSDGNDTVDAASTEAPFNVMQCLRSVSTDDLQRLGNVRGTLPNRNNLVAFYWIPVIDGTLIPTHPTAAYAAGRYVRVPSIIGWCTDEGSLFVANANTQNEMVEWIQDNRYPPNALQPSDIDKMNQLYPLMPPLPNHEPWFPSLSQAYAESTFICGIHDILNSIATTYYPGNSNGRIPPVYGYHFDVKDPVQVSQGLGVPHVTDAAGWYGWETITTSTLLPSLKPGGINEKVVPLMMGYSLSYLLQNSDLNRAKHPDAPVWKWWGAPAGASNSSTTDIAAAPARPTGWHVIFGNNTAGVRTMADPVYQGIVNRCMFWKNLNGK